MSISNSEIAVKLESFASLLDLAGASYYTARAYRRAAELIRETKAPIADLVREGRARELRGIGSGIEQRLRELVETGELHELVELEQEVAPELVGLGRLIGFGPKRMVEIGRALDVRTVEGFREAAAAGQLGKVPGIGPKTEAKIVPGLARPERPRPRRGMLMNRALALVEAIAEALAGHPAGDPRRWCDTSFDFAVVCASRRPAKILERFERLPLIVAVVEREERCAVGVTVEGVPVQLVVASPEAFGTELVRATGPSDYVAALEPLPDAPDEQSVYRALGIPFCPPELREQPFRGDPPRLLEVADIRGDLHVHSDWSDGKATILEMAEAARPRLRVPGDLRSHAKRARRPGVGRRRPAPTGRGDRGRERAGGAVSRPTRHRVRHPTGRLTRPSGRRPRRARWVQASVHAGQRASCETITKRTIEAMRHPAVRSLSHPKGRIINHRPENELDLDKVFAVALETGTALEVNGLPDRLDLRDEHVQAAVEAGVPIIASTDAHSVRGLSNMRLAVATARRGWATAANVVNTRPLSEIVAR